MPASLRSRLLTRWSRSALASALLALPAPLAWAAAPSDFVTQQLSFRAIRAVEAWGYQTGSSDVVVAILDSGIDHEHPDLEGNLWVNPAEIALNGVDDDGNGYVDDSRGWDFVDGDEAPDDPLGRGTHMAGVVGAVGGNGIGVAGLAWDVTLLPVRVTSGRLDRPYVDAARGAAAIRYAADMGADVILLAFYTDEDDSGLREAVRYAVSKNAVLVVAAGDRGLDLDRKPLYPAAWVEPGMITVANVDMGAKVALSSNYGAHSVAMVAPGVNVFSTLPGSMAGAMSGTAQAAAHVAGGVALFRSHKPALTAQEIAIEVPKLSSNREILEGKCRSASILDLGLLIAEKRETIEAHINAPLKVRVGEQVIFDGTGSEGPIVEYLWKFGDPIDEFGPTVPRRWDRPGRVGVELIVRTFDGRTASKAVNVEIVGNDQFTKWGCSARAPDASGPSGAVAASLAAGLVALLALGRRRD